MVSSPFLREFFGFGGSTMLERASRLVGGLAAAAMLGPLVWGHWYLLNLVLQYGALIHLGALNGMNLAVPAALGQERIEEAEQLRRSSLGFLLCAWGVALVILLLLTTMADQRWHPPGLLPTFFLLGAQHLFAFAITSLRAQAAFGKVTRLQVVSGTVYLPIVLSSTWLWGLNGFILGQTTVNLILVLLTAILEPKLYRPRFDPRHWGALITVGLPIMLVGVMDALFATVDRWVIVAYIDTEALGHYSLAVLTISALVMLPQVVSQQTYPRMVFAWSARHDVAEVRNLATRQRKLSLLAVAMLVVPVVLAAPWAIQHYMPTYTPGLPALLIMLLIPFIACIGQGSGTVLHVLGMQRVYLLLFAISIVFKVIASLVLIQYLGLAGVAIAAVLSHLFLSSSRVLVAEAALKRQ